MDVILKMFNLDLLIGVLRASYDNVLRWMLQDLTDDKSTLVEVIGSGDYTESTLVE